MRKQRAGHFRRRHNKDGTLFDHRQFFLDSLEECKSCKLPRPAHTHYHCMICHSNIKEPKSRNNINNCLKNHFIRKGLNEYPVVHDLTRPSRPVKPVNAFQDLTVEDKCLVREGNFVNYF